MKKICVYQESEAKGMIEGTLKSFGSVDEAKAFADRNFIRMDESDKKSLTAFHIGIYNVDEADNFVEREDGFCDADCYEVIKDYLSTRWVVRDAEAGNVIDEVDSKEEAERLIAEYEAQDKADGTYSYGFYEAAEI